MKTWEKIKKENPGNADDSKWLGTFKRLKQVCDEIDDLKLSMAIVLDKHGPEMRKVAKELVDAGSKEWCERILDINFGPRPEHKEYIEKKFQSIVDSDNDSKANSLNRRIESLCTEIGGIQEKADKVIDGEDPTALQGLKNLVRTIHKKVTRHSEQISELTQRISAIETGEGLRRLEQAHCKHIYGYCDYKASEPAFISDPVINLDVTFTYCYKCGKKLK